MQSDGTLRLVLVAVLVLVLALSSTAIAGGVDNLVVIKPPPGTRVELFLEPGQDLVIDFDPTLAQVGLADEVFTLTFADGGEVAIHGFFDLADNGGAVFVSGIWIPADAIAAQVIAMNDPEYSGHATLETAAAGELPDNGDPGVPANHWAFHTGRGVLFTGETEAHGHPLYSYLIFRRSDQSGLPYERRLQAVTAFVEEVRDAAALEEAGVQKEQINLFYVPLRLLLETFGNETNRLHLSDLENAEKIDAIMENYDFTRAEVWSGSFGLTGDGPYIVSYKSPVGGAGRINRDELLIQDLSRVPPDLVRLWVVEFKRQVASEQRGEPESLRRFALHFRTEIANLAEAFAITREAVAAMFKEPKSK